MHFLFPADPLNPRLPDEIFSDQMAALAGAGLSTSLLPDSVLAEGRPLRGIPPGATAVYRGWMLRPEEYGRLAAAIEAGAVPFITPREYIAAHYLPNWYPLVRELTPETRIYPADADLVQELRALGWEAFFIKDYVKSLKTSVGSRIEDPAQISEVLAEMKKFRGEIEGGICVRRVEALLPESEVRYFVINGTPMGPGPSQEVPDVVRECSGRIPSKFFSVDAAMRSDGVLRVVEIGDGQVSDLVGWPAEAFAEMWRRAVPC